MTVLVNLSDQAVDAAAGEVLPAGGPLTGGLVPPDTAVGVRGRLPW